MAIKTHNINSNPRFTTHLVKAGVFKQSPLVVIDVGARSGFEKHWDLYGDQVLLIGFEPDIEECNRLNREESRFNRKFYPFALSQERGWRDLNIQPHVASSGFYESDPEFLNRFADGWEDLIPERVDKVRTMNLDSFVKENQMRNVDFIKLDAEGAELDIFRGAINMLKTVLGLSTEAVFVPWRKKMPTFTDVDIFIRSLGFVLYDLPVFRWARRTLSPQMFLNKVPGPTPNGQIIWTQAVYFRDAIAEMKISNKWNGIKILKQASIMELYNLEDCAIELIQHASRNNLLDGYNENELIDLLVPPLNGKIVSYSEYVKYLRQNTPRKN